MPPYVTPPSPDEANVTSNTTHPATSDEGSDGWEGDGAHGLDTDSQESDSAGASSDEQAPGEAAWGQEDEWSDSATSDTSEGGSAVGRRLLAEETNYVYMDEVRASMGTSEGGRVTYRTTLFAVCLGIEMGIEI